MIYVYCNKWQNFKQTKQIHKISQVRHFFENKSVVFSRERLGDCKVIRLVISFLIVRSIADQ